MVLTLNLNNKTNIFQSFTPLQNPRVECLHHQRGGQIRDAEHGY